MTENKTGFPEGGENATFSGEKYGDLHPGHRQDRPGRHPGREMSIPVSPGFAGERLEQCSNPCGHPRKDICKAAGGGVCPGHEGEEFIVADSQHNDGTVLVLEHELPRRAPVQGSPCPGKEIHGTGTKGCKGIPVNRLSPCALDQEPVCSDQCRCGHPFDREKFFKNVFQHSCVFSCRPVRCTGTIRVILCHGDLTEEYLNSPDSRG
jgi:hypothetical protein